MDSPRFTVNQSTLSKIWRLLSKSDRNKIKGITFIQICSGGLDLLGVVLVGVVGAITVNGLGPQQAGTKIATVLELLRLDSKSLQVQVAILASAAAGVFVVKTIFSVYFTRRILNFLSHKGAILSSRLIEATLKKSLLELQERSQQELLFSITSGPNILMVGILGNSIAIVADLSLLIILAVTLVAVNTAVALASVFLFTVIGYMLYRTLQKRAQKLGSRNTQLSIKSSTKIIDVFSSYRVLFVRDSRSLYTDEISRIRIELGKVSGESAFIPFISKYVIEAVLVLGSLGLAASQFLLSDATQAIATLTIFLAAGTRIAPAALRIQQSALQIKNNVGICEPTLDFIEKATLAENNLPQRRNLILDIKHEGFNSEVSVAKVSFKYPTKENLALSEVDFSIQPGQFVSIVGPSGSGKSTLADLIIGIIEPQSGKVQISGLAPEEAIKMWPGAISYVPQEVSIIAGTIKENILMGIDVSDHSQNLIDNCIQMAQLTDFISSLPHGIETEVGERGAKLSGGQRQRIGIARALITNPKLVIFDEATSALDGTTEAQISSAIQELKGKITIIMVAHRLSTVRNSDQVVYISNGKLLSKGTFDFVRSNIPDFDTQASLMGL